MNTLQNFSKGLIKENSVLVLVLGTCPTLATSTSVTNALGMGAAATVVLLCSNIVISALRKIIPDKVRIPCYIVLIAGFVTAVQMLVKAFAGENIADLCCWLGIIIVGIIVIALQGENLPSYLELSKALYVVPLASLFSLLDKPFGLKIEERYDK